MSDLRIRVRYHDIEVEVSVPVKERDYLEAGKMTHGAVLETVQLATKQIEALIIAGRKEVAP